MKRFLIALLIIASFPEYVLFIFTNGYNSYSVATAQFYTKSACEYAASVTKKRPNVATAYCIRSY